MVSTSIQAKIYLMSLCLVELFVDDILIVVISRMLVDFLTILYDKIFKFQNLKLQIVNHVTH